MAVELQIKSRALSDITTRALQSQLNSTCFPAFGDAYVDHANVDQRLDDLAQRGERIERQLAMGIGS